jgi:membrane associated rhomboid family serine protease
MQWPRLTSAVKVLLLVNFGVFALNAAYFLTAGQDLGVFLAVSPSDVAAHPLGVLRLITYQFVHSVGNPLHILFNMLVLYFLGTMLEGDLGPRRFTWLYLLSGLSGGVLWLLFCLMVGDPSQRCVGASGSIYGVMVAAACLYPHRLIYFYFIRLKLWVLVAVLVGIAFYMTLITLKTGGGGVADGAHLGGAAYGFLAIKLRGRIRIVETFKEVVDEAKRTQSLQDAQRLDQILAKIKESGLNSLDAGERRFLEKQSKRR